MKVILDSNFFFIPYKFRIDIFQEIESLLNRKIDFVVLSPTYNELEKIAEQGSPKNRRNALLALKFAEKCRIVHVEKSFVETHDDFVVRVAVNWKCPVATNDRLLRQRLRNKNVPVIYLINKSRLQIKGETFT